MKICSKCGAEFEGRSCKPCVSKYMAEYRAKNAEKIRLSHQQEYQKNKERYAEYGRKWKERNPEKYKAMQAKSAAKRRKQAAAYEAEWRKENKEKCAEKAKRWRRNHPEYSNRINEQNRRERKKNNGGVLSKEISKKLLELQKGKCAACRASLDDGFHIDHIMPLSKGGEHADNNVQLLCPFCNVSKHNKHPVDFMQSKGFLL